MSTLVAVVIAAASLSARDAKASVIYQLTPYTLSGGFSIDSGSITVTATAADDMLLDASEIVSFTVNATDELGAFSFSGPGANVVINSPIVIKPTSVTVPFPLNLSDENLMALGDPGSLAYAQWLSINIGAELSSVSLNSRSGLLQSVPASSPIRVAVPEPSAVLLALLGVCVTVRLRSRDRAEQDFDLNT